MGSVWILNEMIGLQLDTKSSPTEQPFDAARKTDSSFLGPVVSDDRHPLSFHARSHSSHDLDHPGLNNLYQIHAQTSLAFIYNDTSVLENYHCAMAFAVLKQTDFLSHLSNTQRLAFRQGVIQCIQATDIAKQPQVLRSFTALTPRFQWKDPTHRQELLVMLMKAADIGNETRGLAVSERWADCLMQEFKAQVDLERQQGLVSSI